jgi:hypothetical protein
MGRNISLPGVGTNGVFGSYSERETGCVNRINAAVSPGIRGKPPGRSRHTFTGAPLPTIKALSHRTRGRPSPLGKNTGSGFQAPRKSAVGSALRYAGLRARPPPASDGDSDISKWQKESHLYLVTQKVFAVIPFTIPTAKEDAPYSIHTPFAHLIGRKPSNKTIRPYPVRRTDGS